MPHSIFHSTILTLSTFISVSSPSDDYCATGFDASGYNGVYVKVDEPVYSQQYNELYSSDYVEINEPVYYGLSSEHRYLFRYYCDAYSCQGYSWRLGHNTRGVTPLLICDSSSTSPPSECEWYSPGSTATQSVHINPGDCTPATTTLPAFSDCTMFYDDMDDPVSTGWLFNHTYGSVISGSDHSGSCASFPCTVLTGNNPTMTRIFRNISSESLTSVQIIYFVRCYTAGYLVQYKWGSSSSWADLYYIDQYVGPINFIHNLEDPPAASGGLPLFIRFRYNYVSTELGLYIDNFYLKATTPFCQTEEPTGFSSTILLSSEPDGDVSAAKSLSSETTVILISGVASVIIICCVCCLYLNRSKSKNKTSKEVAVETDKTRNFHPEINTGDGDEEAEADNNCELEVNTADLENEGVEGDEIRTVVTVQ